jgi:hypothetical protein
MYDQDDPWLPLGMSQNIIAGTYEFRVTTAASTTQGQVKDLAITIDVPDITESFKEVVISASGTRLPITKQYYEIKVVNATLISDGGSAVYVRVIDKDPALGPLIQVFDNSNSPTTGLVDVTIEGYNK